MSVTIAGYKFDGPYQSCYYLENKAGLYAILSLRIDKKKGRFDLIDIGESNDIKAKIENEIENNNRGREWKQFSIGDISFFVCYTPDILEQERKEIEKNIRKKYSGIPCRAI